MTSYAQLLLVHPKDERGLSLADILARRFDVHLATTRAEAFDLVGEHDLAVVVVAARLPDIAGPDLLRRLLSLSPRSIGVLAAGAGDSSALAEVLNRQIADRVLVEPWDSAAILAELDQALVRGPRDRGEFSIVRRTQEVVSEATLRLSEIVEGVGEIIRAGRFDANPAREGHTFVSPQVEQILGM